MRQQSGGIIQTLVLAASLAAAPHFQAEARTATLSSTSLSSGRTTTTSTVSSLGSRVGNSTLTGSSQLSSGALTTIDPQVLQPLAPDNDAPEFDFSDLTIQLLTSDLYNITYQGTAFDLSYALLDPGYLAFMGLFYPDLDFSTASGGQTLYSLAPNDLMVYQSDSPDVSTDSSEATYETAVGSQYTFYVHVTTTLFEAPSVVLTTLLPLDVDVISVTPQFDMGGGACTEVDNLVTCEIGDIGLDVEEGGGEDDFEVAVSEVKTIAFVIQANEAGLAEIYSNVTSTDDFNALDNHPENNGHTLSLNVGGGSNEVTNTGFALSGVESSGLSVGTGSVSGTDTTSGGTPSGTVNNSGAEVTESDAGGDAAQVSRSTNVATAAAAVDGMPVLGSGSTLFGGADSAAVFYGGASASGATGYDTHFSTTDVLQIEAGIEVAPEHVGETGMLFVVAVYTEPTSGVSVIVVKRADGGFDVWDGDLASLQAIDGPRPLQSVEAIDVVAGLSGIPGSYLVFVAYQDAAGEIHYSATPISLVVE